jgi:hypothetical protein
MNLAILAATSVLIIQSGDHTTKVVDNIDHETCAELRCFALFNHSCMAEAADAIAWKKAQEYRKVHPSPCDEAPVTWDSSGSIKIAPLSCLNATSIVAWGDITATVRGPSSTVAAQCFGKQ